MNEAIKLAIEKGGYKPTVYRMMPQHTSKMWIPIRNSDVLSYQVLLDPLFWQALGKALGWQNGDVIEKWGDKDITVNRQLWPYHWHRFIDHIAESKDADSFFRELIKKI